MSDEKSDEEVCLLEPKGDRVWVEGDRLIVPSTTFHVLQQA